MAENYHILGGGVAGLCCAIGLQQQGLPFRLYEKASQISYDEVGLGISHNILPILQEWGLLEKTQAIGAEVRKMIFVDKNRKPFRTLAIKKPALSVHRKHFHEMLAAELLPEKVQLNTTFSFEDLPAEEVVIAAQGAFSESRRKLYPHIHLRQSRQILWRGMASLKLDSSFHHSYFDFIDHNLRFAIIHTGKDLYSWYLIRENQPDGVDHLPDEETPPPDTKQMLLELLKDYAPEAKEVIMHTENIYLSVLQDMDPAKRAGLAWHQGKLVLIGDAIHPTTPNMANGACLAMEDAYVLTHLLKKYPQHPSTAFQLFQELREQKVNTVVKRSWALGQMMHQPNKIMTSLMLAGTRLMPQWAFDQLYAGVLNDESLRKVRVYNTAPA